NAFVLHSDRHFRGRCDRIRRLHAGGGEPRPFGEVQQSQARALRVRNRALDRCARSLQHSVLPGGDVVRHLRRRDGVHVSLGGHLRQAAAVRAHRDDCVHLHSGGWVLLRLAERRARMGVEPPKPPGATHPPAAAPPSGPPDPPPPAAVTVPAFITSLQAAIPGGVRHVSYWVGDWTVIVPVDKLLELATYLCDAPDQAFDMCSDVTATDWPPRPERFDVVYCLYSIRHRHRLRVKVRAAENQPVPS